MQPTAQPSSHQSIDHAASHTTSRADCQAEPKPPGEWSPGEEASACQAGQTEWFRAIYRDAQRDAQRVPWADGCANPYLLDWLNGGACGLLRPGARACVVGCGLGDDVAELERRGFDAQGFDVAEEAIAWARQRHPDLGDRLQVADAFDPPSRLIGRFELVVEIYTIQAVEPGRRAALAEGLARLVKPHGVVLAVARGRREDLPFEPTKGPPWPLTIAELTTLMDVCGLAPCGSVHERPDEQDPAIRRLWGAFRPGA